MSRCPRTLPIVLGNSNALFCPPEQWVLVNLMGLTKQPSGTDPVMQCTSQLFWMRDLYRTCAKIEYKL